MEFDVGTLVFIAAFLWYLLSAARPKGKPAPPAPRRPSPPPGAGAGRPAFDTQAEARRLERLLQGRPPAPDPAVVSLETPPQRGHRPRVVYDEASAELERVRTERARARDHALGDADHAAFDERIRRPSPPVARASRRPARVTRIPLRDAVVWREVLGPPVSLRDD